MGFHSKKNKIVDSARRHGQKKEQGLEAGVGLLGGDTRGGADERRGGGGAGRAKETPPLPVSILTQAERKRRGRRRPAHYGQQRHLRATSTPKQADSGTLPRIGARPCYDLVSIDATADLDP